MHDARPVFRLAIIGGCMSHQRDTPLEALYHRRLARVLEAHLGIRLRVRVVRSFDADLPTRLGRLEGDEVDGVLVHLRSFGLVRALRLIRRVRDVGGSHLEVHPSISRWLRAWPRTAAHIPAESGVGAGDHDGDAYGDSPDEQDAPPPGLRIAGHRVRDLNMAAATVLGLDREAIRGMLREFEELETASRARGLPIFVLGPTPATYSYWTRRVVRRAEAAMSIRLRATSTPFALVDGDRGPVGVTLTRADGVHLTPEGHGVVAERLYDAGIGEWMAAIVSSGGELAPGDSPGS